MPVWQEATTDFINILQETSLFTAGNLLLLVCTDETVSRYKYAVAPSPFTACRRLRASAEIASRFHGATANFLYRSLKLIQMAIFVYIA